MGCIDGNPLGGQQQDALGGSPVQDGRSPQPRAIHQSGDPLGAVATVPEVHGRPPDVQDPGGFPGTAAPSSESRMRARRV